MISFSRWALNNATAAYTNGQRRRLRCATSKMTDLDRNDPENLEYPDENADEPVAQELCRELALDKAAPANYSKCQHTPT